MSSNIPPRRTHPYAILQPWRIGPNRGAAKVRRQGLSSSILDDAGGFPYSRRLRAHRSCVNALAFSSGEGRFLASGGDDLKICLWDFHQDDIQTPSFSLGVPRGNIFTIQFTATNRYLLVGGTDPQLLRYDVTYLGSSINPPDILHSPIQAYDTTDSIRDITSHPTQDELFMSASEDGLIRRYDVRSSASLTSQDVIQVDAELTGLQYHPTMEHLFISGDSKGRLLLRDARMAFGPQSNRSQGGVVRQYNTKLSKLSVPYLVNPEVSSFTFDKDGSRLAVTFQHFLPTVYAVSDPNPIAVLDAKTLPDGTPVPNTERTYRNSCTMKHGSFGGYGSEFNDLYAAGSDDFRSYIWRIPSTQQLQARREVLLGTAWEEYNVPETVAFTESTDVQAPRVLPVRIHTPYCCLTGHNSIVNSTLFHPHLLHLVTAGVERDVILHSPTSSSPCTHDVAPSPSSVRELGEDADGEDRQIYRSALEGLEPLPIDREDDAAEEQTLRLFDHLLRQEGDVDLFQTRRLATPDDSSEDGQDESGDDDDDDDGIQ